MLLTSSAAYPLTQLKIRTPDKLKILHTAWQVQRCQPLYCRRKSRLPQQMIQLVRKAVTTGDWSQLSFTIYRAVKEELWVVGQVLTRGTRIVMPQSLWKQTIIFPHKVHQGMVRTKARLLEKVWWPQMGKKVEDAIRLYHPYQLVGPRAKPDPVMSTSFPDGPWREISVDLHEISNGEHLFVVVDYYSCWLETIPVKETTRGSCLKT